MAGVQNVSAPVDPQLEVPEGTHSVWKGEIESLDTDCEGKQVVLRDRINGCSSFRLLASYLYCMFVLEFVIYLDDMPECG